MFRTERGDGSLDALELEPAELEVQMKLTELEPKPDGTKTGSTLGPRDLVVRSPFDC